MLCYGCAGVGDFRVVYPPPAGRALAEHDLHSRQLSALEPSAVNVRAFYSKDYSQ